MVETLSAKRKRVVISNSDGKMANCKARLDVHRQQQDQQGQADVEREQEIEQHGWQRQHHHDDDEDDGHDDQSRCAGRSLPGHPALGFAPPTSPASFTLESFRRSCPAAGRQRRALRPQPYRAPRGCGRRPAPIRTELAPARRFRTIVTPCSLATSLMRRAKDPGPLGDHHRRLHGRQGRIERHGQVRRVGDDHVRGRALSASSGGLAICRWRCRMRAAPGDRLRFGAALL